MQPSVSTPKRLVQPRVSAHGGARTAASPRGQTHGRSGDQRRRPVLKINMISPLSALPSCSLNCSRALGPASHLRCEGGQEGGARLNITLPLTLLIIHTAGDCCIDWISELCLLSRFRAMVCKLHNISGTTAYHNQCPGSGAWMTGKIILGRWQLATVFEEVRHDDGGVWVVSADPVTGAVAGVRREGGGRHRVKTQESEWLSWERLWVQ